MQNESLRNNLNLSERLNEFLKFNYVVIEHDVDLVIEESEKHKTEHLSAVNYLINKANNIAENLGITKDNNFPMSHLPTIIEAVKELESDVPIENKQISDKRNIELLVTGELTSARLSATPLKRFEGIEERVKKLESLLDFRSRF